MSTLVPEHRTDTTGRTQIRWVKAAQAPGKQGIPAPAPAQSSAPAPTVADIAARVRRYAYECGLDDPDAYADLAEGALTRASPRGLRALDEAFDSELGPVFDFATGDGWKNEEELLNGLSYAAALDYLASADQIVEVVNGAGKYGLFTVDGADVPLHALQGRDREVAAALCYVAATLDNVPVPEFSSAVERLRGGAKKIRDEALVALVAERPGDTDDLCRLMLERRTADPVFLRAWLDEQSPLRGGVL